MSDQKEKIDNVENNEEKDREGARIITIQKLAGVFCHNMVERWYCAVVDLLAFWWVNAMIAKV